MVDYPVKPLENLEPAVVDIPESITKPKSYTFKLDAVRAGKLERYCDIMQIHPRDLVASVVGTWIENQLKDG